jgi:DNA-binding MarR family transcriptional regulator
MPQAQAQFGLELLRLTRRCRGIDKYVSTSIGLRVDEVHCLTALFSEKPSSVRTLSELINVTPTRASKILRDLEQRGCVSRTIDAADHRKEHVILTEAGKQTVERLLSLYGEFGQRVLGGRAGEIALDVTQLLELASHPD